MSWKKVYEQEGDTAFDFTHRLEAPGGWLYRNMLILAGTYYVTMTFVPAPEKCPEHDEYRIMTCYTCTKDFIRRNNYDKETNNGT
jgi:hypothetical protein